MVMAGRRPFNHLWLIAVPEEELNNKYDYPVGLVYLIASGLFFFLIVIFSGNASPSCRYLLFSSG